VIFSYRSSYFFDSIESICKIIAYGLIIPPKPSTASTTFGLWQRKLLQVLSFVQKSKQTDDTNTITTAIEEDEDSEAVDFKRNHRAYLNSFGNCFDAISIVSYWSDMVLMIFGYPYLSLFKSLGALRPVRLLSILPGTAVILKSLETSWDILLAVTGLILFFLLLFALVGLISFRGVFSRRCYFTDSDNTRKVIFCIITFI
jgi:Na+-transporting NADH:ubiquinone oxidoreductase subunit NqrB